MIQNTNKHVEKSCHYLKQGPCKAQQPQRMLSDWGAEHQAFSPFGQTAKRITFLLSLWELHGCDKNKKKIIKKCTAVPLKTPVVWGMLRNLSWGRLEGKASLSWDWTQRRKTKITLVEVSTSESKSSYFAIEWAMQRWSLTSRGLNALSGDHSLLGSMGTCDIMSVIRVQQFGLPDGPGESENATSGK